MIRWIPHLVVVCIPFISCGPSRSPGDSWTLDDLDDEVSNDPGSSGVRVDRVAVTTEVDPITFAPVGPPARSFPVSASRLFLSFRIRGVSPGAGLSVAWLRRGEDDPLSETTETLSGDQRMAAEHVADTPFASGPHLVRLSLDGEVLVEVPFEIEGPGAEPVGDAGSANPTVVSNLGVYAFVDQRGRPRGRASQRFPAGTKSVHCAFQLSKAPPGTSVTVSWALGPAVVATTELGEVSGRRYLSASLDSPTPLESGEYTVEVRIQGRGKASRRFSVLGRVLGSGRIDGLVLTSAVDRRSHRPAAATTTSFRGDEDVIYLCLAYQGLRPGEVVEVRWFQDDHPDEVMAVSTVPAAGSGHLAASLIPDGPLPAGQYHAEVYLRDRMVASVPFTVGL